MIFFYTKKLLNKVRPKYLRRHFIDSIPKDISILELGPFYSPMLSGDNVKYFDILDQVALIERAKTMNYKIDTENIPYINFISPTGDLSVVTETFDAVVSSHVIEHQLDFINHLQQVSRLLHKGVKYYLVVPDKRYCFDHFNKESTMADIINAHQEKRSKHSLKSVIEHRALTTHNNAKLHWAGKHGVLSDVPERTKKAIAEYNINDYVDVHGFYFTPNSFPQIIKLLHEMGYIDFTINRLHKTSPNNFEFYCVLQKMK